MTGKAIIDAIDQKLVLIVDDEFVCASVLQAYLKVLGIEADIVVLSNESIGNNNKIGYIWSTCCKCGEGMLE